MSDNLLRNPNAAQGLQHWTIQGDVDVVSGGPTGEGSCFIFWGLVAFLRQEVTLPEGCTGVHVEADYLPVNDDYTQGNSIGIEVEYADGVIQTLSIPCGRRVK